MKKETAKIYISQLNANVKMDKLQELIQQKNEFEKMADDAFERAALCGRNDDVVSRKYYSNEYRKYVIRIEATEKQIERMRQKEAENVTGRD